MPTPETKWIFYFLACILCGHASHAQQNDAEKKGHPYISWVSQFPANRPDESKQNTARRIYNFLLQKNKESGLSRPVGLLANDPSSIWVLDQGEENLYLVRKNKLEATHVTRKKENYFTSLVAMSALPDGSLLFTDSRLNKVFLLGNDDKKLHTLNDTLPLQQPTGVAYNPATKEIWVVETNAHRIAILSRNGALIKRIGERGDAPGMFNYPTSIWIDTHGDAYVVDAMNFRVEIFSSDGKFLSTFGEAGDGIGYFSRPKGIATDSYGNIYVADALFHTVQVFDRAGTLLSSFGKQGREKEEFWMPAGLYIDKNNYIYVADSYNSRVQIFQLINGS